MIAKLFVIGLVAVMCSLSSGCARDTIDALSGDSDGYGDIRPQLGVKDLEDAGFVNPTSLSTSQDLKNDKLLFRVWYGVCAVDLDMDPFFSPTTAGQAQSTRLLKYRHRPISGKFLSSESAELPADLYS
jgi:hypothetical protein